MHVKGLKTALKVNFRSLQYESSKSAGKKIL